MLAVVRDIQTAADSGAAERLAVISAERMPALTPLERAKWQETINEAMRALASGDQAPPAPTSR
jgi:hypothetical protein